MTDDLEKLHKFIEFMKCNFPHDELIFDYRTGNFTSNKTQDIFKVWNLARTEPSAMIIRGCLA